MTERELRVLNREQLIHYALKLQSQLARREVAFEKVLAERNALRDAAGEQPKEEQVTP